MAQAEYDKLEDNTFSGRIPVCQGVIAFGNTLRICETELCSTLEDWLLVGLKLGILSFENSHFVVLIACTIFLKIPWFQKL